MQHSLHVIAIHFYDMTGSITRLLFLLYINMFKEIESIVYTKLIYGIAKHKWAVSPVSMIALLFFIGL